MSALPSEMVPSANWAPLGLQLPADWMNWRLSKCGSVAVEVSLWRTLPVSASATNRSIENRSFSDRNTTLLPSGLRAGATFRSPPCLSVTTARLAWLGTFFSSSTCLYCARSVACHSLLSSSWLMPSTSLIAFCGSPERAAVRSMRPTAASP